MTDGEGIGVFCCACGELSDSEVGDSTLISVGADIAAELAGCCVCVERGGALMDFRSVDSDFIGAMAENLDVDGYRPMGSGQVMKSEQENNRNSFDWVPGLDGCDVGGEV